MIAAQNPVIMISSLTAWGIFAESRRRTWTETSFGNRRLQQGSEVSAEGGLGRFDLLPETPQTVKDEIMRFVYYPGQ